MLFIYNPKVEDTGKYTIDIGGVSSTAFLNVDGKLQINSFTYLSQSKSHFQLNFSEPDPTYTFIKPLNQQTSGFDKHEVQLECTVSSSMAKVEWYRGKTKLEVRIFKKHLCSLVLK